MKMFLTLAAVLAAGLTGYPQSTTGSMESQIQRALQNRQNQNLMTMPTERPNEIRRGTVSYSGVIVQFIKSDNKLQLINPAAPPQYGSGLDNLVMDRSPEIMGASPAAGNGGRQGLKLFSIQF